MQPQHLKQRPFHRNCPVCIEWASTGGKARFSLPVPASWHVGRPSLFPLRMMRIKGETGCSDASAERLGGTWASWHCAGARCEKQCIAAFGGIPSLYTGSGSGKCAGPDRRGVCRAHFAGTGLRGARASQRRGGCAARQRARQHRAAGRYVCHALFAVLSGAHAGAGRAGVYWPAWRLLTWRAAH